MKEKSKGMFQLEGTIGVSLMLASLVWIYPAAIFGGWQIVIFFGVLFVWGYLLILCAHLLKLSHKFAYGFYRFLEPIAST
ncbi:hypothetical protein F3K50_14530 [Pseudomonas marginalis]|nr:hypothetical protein F3K50_14530 [Pseudomonas marginalis]